MKRIAVVSDIHGNLLALEKVVENLTWRHVETVFNLGDHLSGPLWPKETAQFLMKQAWVHIKGNHDRQLTSLAPENHGPSDGYAYQVLDAADLSWLVSLPATQWIQEDFFLCHGSPSSDSTYFLETVAHGKTSLAAPDEIIHRLGNIKSQIILCGHTHVPRVVETTGHGLVLNPGSVGLPAYEDLTPEYHVVETGSTHARYAILEYRNGFWVPELISVPYDYHLAAEQARKNDRPDWEVALLTGYMRAGNS